MTAVTQPDLENRLVKNHVRKVAKRLIKHTLFLPSDFEDIVQELMLALVESKDDYEAEKSPWTYFAFMVVERKAASMRRARSAARRGGTMMIASLNVLVPDEDGQPVELAQKIYQSESGARLGIEKADPLEQVEQALNVESVRVTLPRDLAAICELLREKSVAETARQLGIPRTTLISRLEKIRDLFVEAGLDQCV